MPTYRVEDMNSNWAGKVTADSFQKQLDKAAERGWVFHSVQPIADGQVVVFEQD